MYLTRRSEIGQYAIISHTWEKNEPTFSDFGVQHTAERMVDLLHGDYFHIKSGYHKLDRFADVVKASKIPPDLDGHLLYRRDQQHGIPTLIELNVQVVQVCGDLHDLRE